MLKSVSFSWSTLERYHIRHVNILPNRQTACMGYFTTKDIKMYAGCVLLDNYFLPKDTFQTLRHLQKRSICQVLTHVGHQHRLLTQKILPCFSR